MLHKEDLDTAARRGCQVPGCTDHDHERFLHGKCHPGGVTEVSYALDSGVLKIACRVCHAPIADVSVARASDDLLRTRVSLLEDALQKSVELQSHYAGLLNQYDGGKRLQFLSATGWIDRLQFVEDMKRAKKLEP